MFKKVIILLTLSLGLAHANSFALVKVEPKNATVFEGSDLDLFCGANDYFGFCSFVHSDKKCEFQWKKSPWNFTSFSCPGNPFGNQAILIEGLYKNETCGIRLKNVTKEYSGNWTCQLESYHKSHEDDHNFGKKANGSIHVNVIPKSEITNLTTSKEKVPNGPKKEFQNPGKKVQNSNITSGLAHANSFDLVKVEPKNATVLEGSNLDLFCSVNEYFGFCTFYHSGKNCEFQWKKNSWNFTNYDCPGNPFGHPAVLIEGLYKNETCGIKLTQVTKEYSGNWTCQLESYHVSHENQKGFGKKVNGSIYVNVISNVLDPETQNRNAVIIGLLLVGSLIVGVLLMFLGRKKDLDLRIYKSQWSWSRLPSQSTDDLVDPMCERVNQNPDFL